MTYAVDSGRAQPGPACTLENRVSPACGPSAQGIRAGGVLHFDPFGPVYLAPMRGGRATAGLPDVSCVLPQLAGPVRSDAAPAGAFSRVAPC